MTEPIFDEQYSQYMNAYKVEAMLTEDGTLVLEGLPFHSGDTVEIIVLEKPQKHPSHPNFRAEYSLAGSVLRYDNPFEPAVAPEDWDILQ